MQCLLNFHQQLIHLFIKGSETAIYFQLWVTNLMSILFDSWNTKSQNKHLFGTDWTIFNDFAATKSYYVYHETMQIVTCYFLSLGLSIHPN